MKITRVGLDVAKHEFQVHGVNEHGIAKVRRTLARAKVLEFFANAPPCVVGIEACGSAHYWGRELTKLGHTVRLMAAQFVIPSANAARTTPTTPRQSARRSGDRTCISWRSRLRSSRQY